MQINHPAIIVLTCLVALSGCGKSSQEKAMEQAIEYSSGGKAQVDLTGNQVEISTDEGKINVASGKGVTVPDGFPKDIYLHDGAKVMTAMTMPQGQMLTLETADPADKVADAYRTAMSAAGWKQEMAMDSGTGKMLSYSKDKQQAQVTIDGDSDSARTTITIIASTGE